MDLEVKETGNGGDLIKKSKDLSVIRGFENMPYLAMFGGNVEASTPFRRNPSEQAFDYWGNSLLFANNPAVQMNSETERALNNTALSSSGLKIIEQAVKKDLAFMKTFAEVSVVVSIIEQNRILIAIKLVKPGILSQRVFVYIWDATNRELIEREAVPGRGRGYIISDAGIFDFTFDDSFE
jgi:hypothetical protein